jgi:hypothetical protein
MMCVQNTPRKRLRALDAALSFIELRISMYVFYAAVTTEEQAAKFHEISPLLACCKPQVTTSPA